MSLADQSLQFFPVSARVSVLRARGLRIKGKDGTNDAYATLQAGRETFRTPVAEKHAEPVWGGDDAAFIFTEQDGVPLQVRVLHRVPLGADKVLGLTVVNVHELRQDSARENPQWFKLLNKTGKADKERGEVLLDIQFLKSSMSVSMIDLSDKSHSRLGKFKDKLRGKKKEGLSDSASAILPSVSQVLTDSEEELDRETEGESTKKKKNKLKSLFVPKSSMKRNSMSQSMSSLGTLPDKNSSISSSTSSGLNVESEGKKKKKLTFLTHKRNGSTDSKTSTHNNSTLGSTNQNPPSPIDICINGSHVYREETQSEEVQEMEEEEGENEEEEERWRREEEERERLEEERKRKEKEEQRRKEEEEKESIRVEREKEEQRRRMAEEKERIRMEREKEEERRRMGEREKERIRMEREKEEQRRLEEEEKERMRIEREKEEQKRRMEEEEKERIRMEREKEEQMRKMAEEKERIRIEREKEEERRRMEEREKERIRMEREKEEQRRLEEEEKERMRIEREKEEQKRRMEEEEKERIRMEREKEEQMRKMAEEKERIRIEREKEEERRRMEEREKERIRMEREKEEQRRLEEEEKERMRIERQKEEQKRSMEEEEKERIRMEREKEEQRRRIEQEEKERKRMEKEEQQRKLEEGERMRMKREKEEQMRKLEEGGKRKEERGAEELRRKMEEGNDRKKAEEEEKMRIAEEGRVKEEKKRAERKRMMEEEEKQKEEKRIAMERRLADEKKAREEEERRIAEEKEKQHKEEERVREEKERKRTEMEMKRKEEEQERRQMEMEDKKKKEKQMREEQERLRKEETLFEESVISQSTDFPRSARISMKPSMSVSATVSQLTMTNTNPFLDDDLDASISENTSVEEATAKKGRAPLPIQLTGPDVCSRAVSKQHSNLKEVSKRPAPQPPGTLNMTREVTVKENIDQAGLGQGAKKTPERHHESKVLSVTQDVTQVNTNPFTCDGPVAIKHKSPAPKPRSGTSVSEDMPKNGGKNLTESTAHLEEKASASNIKGNPPNWKLLGASNDITVEYVKSDLTDDLSRREHHLEDAVEPESAKPNSPCVSQDLCPEPLVSPTDGLPSMERSQKKSRAPLPPVKPKRTEDPSTPHQQPSLPNKTNLEQAQENHSNKKDQDNTSVSSIEIAAISTPSSTVSSSVFTPLAEKSQVMKPCSTESVETGSGSGSMTLPWAKMVPSDAGEVREQVAPTSVIRQHAVKPLSAAENRPETHESRVTDNIQPKTKAAEAVTKGPYSQLTQTELISLALRQQEQLSKRDARIQELEQYIDDLLVRVMDEKPSILMSLNTKNKSI